MTYSNRRIRFCLEPLRAQKQIAGGGPTQDRANPDRSKPATTFSFISLAQSTTYPASGPRFVVSRDPQGHWSPQRFTASPEPVDATACHPDAVTITPNRVEFQIGGERPAVPARLS